MEQAQEDAVYAVPAKGVFLQKLHSRTAGVLAGFVAIQRMWCQPSLVVSERARVKAFLDYYMDESFGREERRVDSAGKEKSHEESGSCGALISIPGRTACPRRSSQVEALAPCPSSTSSLPEHIATVSARLSTRNAWTLHSARGQRLFPSDNTVEAWP